MALNWQVSSGLRDAVLITGSLRSQLNNGQLVFYTGTIPETADAAHGSATALVSFTTDGLVLASGGTNGLTFEATLSSGALVRTTSESWQGTVSNSSAATATFWRWLKYGDDGSTLSTTAIRMQGTLGGVTGAYDVILDDVTPNDAASVTFNNFSVRWPRYAGEL